MTRGAGFSWSVASLETLARGPACNPKRKLLNAVIQPARMLPNS